ncbi:sensor histidine kinase [Fusibacillus kribbianus]|uniref:histidine kinase n=1 Tax=Fusibacillus kribbianus TaxID=3044208 RepID=A0AAP4BD77_9FIRM|nr:ATP-binding protein [Ruminococcus sp. YH-rum2234]MDI9243128.1 ATP-binding protein [Ruminococcus sp. YH-rum2234]
MKKSIFKKFVLMILLALLVSSTVFGLVMSRRILGQTEEKLSDTLRLMDYILDYEGDVESQIDSLCAIDGNENSRATVLRADGQVLADSGVVDTEQMENHLDREEIREALEKGQGFATRYSKTLHEQMLYAAMTVEDGQYVLRLAVPYEGLYTYLKVLIPAALAGIAVAMAASFFMAERFAGSVSTPLKEIAAELRKVDKGEPEIFMKHYRYEELNVIIDAMNQMSAEIGSYVKKLELERIVRQEFFSNASHELKTPITSIKGYTELLGSGLITKEEVREDFLRRIGVEADNMTSLINDILMISRLETKDVEEEMAVLQICPIVDDVLSSLEPVAADYGVKIYAECEPLKVNASLRQLKELLNNLLMNAVKYNKPDGVVRLTVSSDMEDLVIVVSDTGMGIPKEAQSRVFERFYRVDKGRSKKLGGTGLGLSIVKHIVNYYGGTIGLESQVDVGTTFTVRLPIVIQK